MVVLQPATFDVLKLGTEQEAFKTLNLVPARRDDDGRQVAEPDIHGREEQTSPPTEPVVVQDGAHLRLDGLLRLGAQPALQSEQLVRDIHAR